MSRKILTIYFDDLSLKLLLVQGDSVKTWLELPLEPGVIKGSVILQEAELAARLKLLLKEHGIKTKKVLIGLSGLYCLSRPVVLPQLPRAMLQEAVNREAGRVLPVSAEQYYITFETMESRNDKTHVFLLALPRRTIDPLIRVLRQCRLQPVHLDIKPLALARLSREKTSIIVDVQPGELNIVIMVDGVPQPIRTIALPGPDTPREERLARVRNDIEKTIQFYKTNNPGKPIAPDTPILVSGKSGDNTELAESLSELGGYYITQIASPFKEPPGFNSTDYVANIGLSLAGPGRTPASGSLVAGLNALPEPYLPDKFSLLRVAAVPALVVLIVVLLLMTFLVRTTLADVDTLRGYLRQSQQLLQLKQSIHKDLTQIIAGLEKKLAETESAGDSLTAAISHLEEQRQEINSDLATASGRLPAQATITTINHADGSMTIRAVSSDKEAILEYARAMDASGRYGKVNLSSIRKDKDGNYTFILMLVVREPG
ncbi:MAG: pilus assembly protein PilM [Chloroflexi bacterium]|nr:pilus assembly protein PilM [Chloroflexota bacterium]